MSRQDPYTLCLDLSLYRFLVFVPGGCWIVVGGGPSHGPGPGDERVHVSATGISMVLSNWVISPLYK